MVIDRHGINGVDDLVELFFDAAKTERKLPAAYRGGYATMRFEIPQDPSLAYGYNEVQVRPGPATSREVSKYDLALELTAKMDADDAKLVWAAAHSAARRARGPHWVAISKILGVHPQTVKRRFSRAILELWYKM